MWYLRWGWPMTKVKPRFYHIYNLVLERCGSVVKFVQWRPWGHGFSPCIPQCFSITRGPFFMNIHERFLFSFLFSKKIFFISSKKSAIGLQDVHQKVFYTKEVVKARTRGDDISISVLERRLWTKATSSIIAVIFSCSWEQPPKNRQ